MEVILSDRLKKITDEQFNDELQYQLNQFLTVPDSKNICCYQSQVFPIIITIFHFTDSTIIITDEEILTNEQQ